MYILAFIDDFASGYRVASSHVFIRFLSIYREASLYTSLISCKTRLNMLSSPAPQISRETADYTFRLDDLRA